MKLSQSANTQHISYFHPFQKPMNCHFPPDDAIHSFIVKALQDTSSELFSTIHWTTSELENHMHSYDHEQRDHKYSAGIKCKIHDASNITKKKKERKQQTKTACAVMFCMQKEGEGGPISVCKYVSAYQASYELCQQQNVPDLSSPFQYYPTLQLHYCGQPPLLQMLDASEF